MDVGHTRCAVCRVTIDEIRVASSRADVGSGYRAFVSPPPPPPTIKPRPRPVFDDDDDFTGCLLRQCGGCVDSRLAVLGTVTRALRPLEIPGSAGAPNTYVFALDISCECGPGRLGGGGSGVC
jgi:hypothetical protein